MNILSLFDGISCGRIALERSNIKVDNYFASEIDKNAIKISKHNYPDIIQLGDVRELTEDVLNKLPKIDLLIGGSPCQNLSSNGDGSGLNGSKSKLFWEYVRILKIVKPKFFLLENVHMKKQYEHIISEELNVNPIDINSNLLSAQNRPRLYWTNIPNVTLPKDKNINLKDILVDDQFNLKNHYNLKVDSNYNNNEIALINVVNDEVRISQATKQGYIVAESGDGVNLSFATSKTRRGRVIRQKSNTLDCQCNISVYYDNIVRRLNITELERLQTLPDGYTNVGISDSGRKKAIGNGWTVDVIAHIFNHINK